MRQSMDFKSLKAYFMYLFKGKSLSGASTLKYLKMVVDAQKENNLLKNNLQLSDTEIKNMIIFLMGYPSSHITQIIDTCYKLFEDCKSTQDFKNTIIQVMNRLCKSNTRGSDVAIEHLIKLSDLTIFDDKLYVEFVYEAISGASVQALRTIVKVNPKALYDNKNIAAIISKYRDKDNMFATNYKSIMNLYYIGHPELTRYGLEVGDLSLVPETMRDMFVF